MNLDTRLDLGPVPPKRLSAGTHRIATSEETLARMRPLMPRLGITRLANVTGLDRIGIPVALAIRPNARAIAVSQGKGRSLAAAQASALMESIELWHAEHIDLPLRYGTMADMAARAETIDLTRLPRVANGSARPGTRMLWAPGHDLMTGRARLVPHEMVHADYTAPGLPGAGTFPASTNGLASGNHQVEAICHAICEVIERDALSVWHALPEADQHASALDPNTVEDPWTIGALRAMSEAGLEVRLWDVTSNIGVATVMCILRDPDADSGHLGLGSGTHPDRAIALSRAVSEAAQTRLNYISGAREDLGAEEYGPSGIADKLASVAPLFEGPSPTRTMADLPCRVSESLTTDLDWLLEQLVAVGVSEVASVDLSRPELGVPVARVVIPGLEAPHDDSSYVPGHRAGGAP